MTIANVGLNIVRDLTSAEVFSAQAGTGNTLPLATNTGLETAAPDTLGTVAGGEVTVTKSNKLMTITHTVPSGTTTNTTLSEWVSNVDSGNTILHRTVTAGVVVVSGIEVSKITSFTFEGN